MGAALFRWPSVMYRVILCPGALSTGAGVKGGRAGAPPPECAPPDWMHDGGIRHADSFSVGRRGFCPAACARQMCSMCLPLCEWVRFDLGAVFALDQVWVWNYNEQSDPGRQAASMEIRISSETTGDLGSLQRHEQAVGQVAAVHAEGFEHGFGHTGPSEHVALRAHTGGRGVTGLSHAARASEGG